MRKFLSILFLAVYILSTSGVVIAKHFCGTELEKINLFAKANCCGDCEQVEEEEGCCKDEFNFSRINDNQLAEEKKNLSEKTIDDVLIINTTTIADTKFTTYNTSLHNIVFAKPFYNYKNKLYLKYCTLVLYA